MSTQLAGANIIALPTAAARPVQQPRTRASRDERAKLREHSPWRAPEPWPHPSAKAREPVAVEIERTPELAFILAIVNAMPRQMRSDVLAQVMLFEERLPECAASLKAARLAAMLTLKGSI